MLCVGHVWCTEPVWNMFVFCDLQVCSGEAVWPSSWLVTAMASEPKNRWGVACHGPWNKQCQHHSSVHCVQYFTNSCRHFDRHCLLPDLLQRVVRLDYFPHNVNLHEWVLLTVVMYALFYCSTCIVCIVSSLKLYCVHCFIVPLLLSALFHRCTSFVCIVLLFPLYCLHCFIVPLVLSALFYCSTCIVCMFHRSPCIVCIVLLFHVYCLHCFIVILVLSALFHRSTSIVCIFLLFHLYCVHCFIVPVYCLHCFIVSLVLCALFHRSTCVVCIVLLFYLYCVLCFMVPLVLSVFFHFSLSSATRAGFTSQGSLSQNYIFVLRWR